MLSAGLNGCTPGTGRGGARGSPRSGCRRFRGNCGASRVTAQVGSRHMSSELSTPTSGTPGWTELQVPPTRQNPERLAWTVLLASFAIFLILLVTVPLALRYGAEMATVPQSATLDPSQGTVLLYAPDATEPIAVTEVRENISEGSVLEAGDSPTQATLRLSAESGGEALGSVQLYSGTRLAVDSMRSPMFAMSQQPHRALLRLDQGQARIFTNSGGDRALFVKIETPHGLIELAPGQLPGGGHRRADGHHRERRRSHPRTGRFGAPGGRQRPACLDDGRRCGRRAGHRRRESAAQRQLHRVDAGHLGKLRHCAGRDARPGQHHGAGRPPCGLFRAPGRRQRAHRGRHPPEHREGRQRLRQAPASARREAALPEPAGRRLSELRISRCASRSRTPTSTASS